MTLENEAIFYFTLEKYKDKKDSKDYSYLRNIIAVKIQEELKDRDVYISSEEFKKILDGVMKTIIKGEY